MNLDPGVVCFEHCNQIKLFSFNVPHICPICRKDISRDVPTTPPFRLPYPFSRASQVSSCIVIKPTKGDFLHDYENSCNLHIGITDSRGNVYEYDDSGINWTSTVSWNQCIAVPVLRNSIAKNDSVSEEYWDFTLSTIASQDRWSMERYHEDGFNCYTFVLEFLRLLQLPHFRNVKLTKTNFCSTFIIPRTSSAAKYISLYRQILHESVVANKGSKENSNQASERRISTTRC